jgi:hypothetical protein
MLLVFDVLACFASQHFRVHKLDMYLVLQCADPMTDPFCCLQISPCLQGKPENVAKAQEALLKRAKANSDAQLGKYDPATEGSSEAAKSLYEKGYKY